MEIDDEYVIEYFSTRKVWNDRNIHKIIYNYLVSRYSDTTNTHESLYRIIHNLDIKPICVICGKPVKFLRFSTGYSKYCSRNCMNNDIAYKNKLSKAIKNGMHNMSPECFYTMRTNISKAQSNLWKTDEYRQNQILLIKKGFENMTEEKKIEHRQNTSIGTKIGIANMSDDCKKRLSIKRSENASNIEYQQKKNNTTKKNNSYGKSKTEDLIFEQLSKKYNVIRQYFSEKYPFNCDFYIPEKDLYIEYNGSQYHHFHKYDPVKDKDELIRLQNKDKEKEFLGNINNQYKKIIETWTVRDINKFNTAKENNLNYLVFYNYNEFLDWFEKQ